MNSKDTEDLLARRLAGEDVTHGEPQISYEPIHPTGHPDGDVKVGKSLRVPLAMFAQISAIAEQRRMSWSDRDWRRADHRAWDCARLYCVGSLARPC
jgi:hypothetical protein